MSDNEKLKIAINPSVEIWNQEYFRDFMKNKITKDQENTVLYILTENSDNNFIERVRSYIGVKDELTIIKSTKEEIAEFLLDNKILIYLSDNEEVNDFINKVNTLNLKINNISGTVAIGVFSSLVDLNKLQPMWVTKLTFWTNQIKRFRNGEKS
jgi:hypothetical protein